VDGISTGDPEWIHGSREKRALALLQDATVLKNWEKEDFKTYILRGGRARIRALTDWVTEASEMSSLSPLLIAKDEQPLKSLIKVLRSLRNKGFKKYRLNQVTSQFSLFYENFFGAKSMGRNKVLRATLDEVVETTKPPQKYTDVMPVEKLVSWINAQGANDKLSRFQLYKKFILTLQIACIARAADIFRLRFSTLEKDHPKRAITFVTQTKASQGKGFYLYLFEIPAQPNVCPVRTTLALKQKWEDEVQKKKWKFDKDVIHVNEHGVQLTRADQIGKLLQSIHKEAGIDTQRWRPNNARHAVITFYRASGITDTHIKLITGHTPKSSVTQDFYTLPLTKWSEKSILVSNINGQEIAHFEEEIIKSGGPEGGQPDVNSQEHVQNEEIPPLVERSVETTHLRRYPERTHHIVKKYAAEEWLLLTPKRTVQKLKRKRTSSQENTKNTRDDEGNHVTDITTKVRERDPGSQ
jgi:hypothetical protein